MDGIILSGPRYDDEELPRVHAQGAHIVLLGQLPHSDVPYVDVDNVGGAMLATQHLLALGHRHIGLITNGSPAYTASADRLAGYRQALEWKKHIDIVIASYDRGFDKIPSDRRAEAFRMNDGGWTQQMKNIEKHVAQTS